MNQEPQVMDKTMNCNKVPSPNDKNNLESELNSYLIMLSSGVLFS